MLLCWGQINKPRPLCYEAVGAVPVRGNGVRNLGANIAICTSFGEVVGNIVEDMTYVPLDVRKNMRAPVLSLLWNKPRDALTML